MSVGTRAVFPWEVALEAGEEGRKGVRLVRFSLPNPIPYLTPSYPLEAELTAPVLQSCDECILSEELGHFTPVLAKREHYNMISNTEAEAVRLVGRCGG